MPPFHRSDREVQVVACQSLPNFDAIFSWGDADEDESRCDTYHFMNGTTDIVGMKMFEEVG